MTPSTKKEGKRVGHDGLRSWTEGIDKKLEETGTVVAAEVYQLTDCVRTMLSELKRELDWLQHVKPQITAPVNVLMGFDQAIKYISAAISKQEGRDA